MINKSGILKVLKINMLLGLGIVTILPLTLSKFQSSITGNINSNIAFYLVEVGYQTESIKLTDLVPSQTPYVYTFTIGNENDDSVSEVDINYQLKIITTTNLPLNYELYENEDYQLAISTNLITNNNTTIATDNYGTYFQTFEFENEELYYSNPTTNNYTLLVYYDENETNSKYQDMIESIRIEVYSEQMID